MRTFAAFWIGIGLLAGASPAPAGTASIDDRAWKRTRGVPTSQPGVYLERNDLLVDNASRYYRLGRYEYAPSELGHSLDRDFFGSFSSWERLLYVSYGLTDRVSVETEARFVSEAVLETSPRDPVSRRVVRESGLGDLESRVNWQWLSEGVSLPGAFSFGEVSYPLQGGNRIITDGSWDCALGTGILKNLPFGMIAMSASAQYESDDGTIEPAELGIDYLKKVTTDLRFLAALDRLPNEWEFMIVAQFRDFSPARFPEDR